MGSHQSRMERKEIVSRYKARKRYLKHLVKATQSLSASHSNYLRSLRSTGSAFVHFSSIETKLHHPPLSPASPTPTWISSSDLSPPPPPPPPASSSWEFWDPFVPSPPSSVEDWDNETATTATPPPSSNDTVRHTKDLLEITKEINEHFMKAAESASYLFSLLEISTSIKESFPAHTTKGGNMYSNYECNLNPWRIGTNPKSSQVRTKGDIAGDGCHSSTIERLYAWEKKLFREVKNAESMKTEHEKMVDQAKKLEMKKVECVRVTKDVEKLESRLTASSQAIESATNEINRLRETQLYPQLIDLVKGMMCMWRSMYESHQFQSHTVQQLKYLSTIPSTEPTSQLHCQSTLQLELEIQQWHQSLCNLVKAQRDYIQSLTGWLRLSLFQLNKNPLVKSSFETKMYNFCEEWHLAIDRIPDKVASEGIKSLLTAVNGIMVQQADEQKQKKRSESMLKEFEKKEDALKMLESKYGPERGEMNVVVKKRGKVELQKGKAEEEKSKHETAMTMSREMTVKNLQTGFTHVFQAMVGFSSVCMEAFESVYNQAKSIAEEQQEV